VGELGTHHIPRSSPTSSKSGCDTSHGPTLVNVGQLVDTVRQSETHRVGEIASDSGSVHSFEL
jgi:hypothetical protein